MQSSRLISDSDLPLAVNASNFPGLALAINEDSIVEGDGVNSAGSATCLITGRVFTPDTVADALNKTLFPAGAFGQIASSGFWLGAGAAMPTVGTRNMLAICVRHADSAANAMLSVGVTGGGGTSPKLNFRGDGGAAPNYYLFGASSSDYLNGGAVTGFAAGVHAHAVLFDRQQASAVARVTQRIATDVSTNLTVGASTRTGSGFDYAVGSVNQFGPDILNIGADATGATNGIYGIYVFILDNPAQILGSTLNSVLQWMARNPTKGLHPFFKGLT